MPQNRTFLKGKTWNARLKCKFRIGTRENGVPAMTMSTKALLEVLSNKNKAKWHTNAKTALAYRGNLADHV